MSRPLFRRALLAAPLLLPAFAAARGEGAPPGEPATTAPAATGPAATGDAGTGTARYVVGDLVLTAPWSRPALAGGTGAGFVTIRNTGTTADRLVAAQTVAARTAELHESSMADGIMRMRPVEALEIPPGGTVVLAPGGLHLMLVGLVAPLRLGDRVPVTLHFAHGGAVHLDFVVQVAAPPGPER